MLKLCMTAGLLVRIIATCDWDATCPEVANSLLTRWVENYQNMDLYKWVSAEKKIRFCNQRFYQCGGRG